MIFFLNNSITYKTTNPTGNYQQILLGNSWKNLQKVNLDPYYANYRFLTLFNVVFQISTPLKSLL